jgi:hypothetical protein
MGVGHMTVKRAEKFAQGLDAIGQSAPELKAEILSGKTEVLKKDVREVAILPEAERPAAIERIKRGERLDKPEPPKPQKTEPQEKDYSFLTQDHKLVDEDPEFGRFLHSMAEDSELIGQLKEAMSVPAVSEFLIKSIKDKLTQYPDTIENADNPERKAFINVFNVLKKIIRK